MFYFAPVLTLGVSKNFLNIPNKDYWLKEENLPDFQKRFGYYMAEFGVAIFIFFFCISLLAIQANLRDPVQLDNMLFMIVFIAPICPTRFGGWSGLFVDSGCRIPDRDGCRKPPFAYLVSGLSGGG